MLVLKCSVLNKTNLLCLRAKREKLVGMFSTKKEDKQSCESLKMNDY